MEQQLLTMRQVSERIGFTQQSVYRWITAGTFPAPLKVGSRAIRFRLAEIEEWESRQERAVIATR